MNGNYFEPAKGMARSATRRAALMVNELKSRCMRND